MYTLGPYIQLLLLMPTDLNRNAPAAPTVRASGSYSFPMYLLLQFHIRSSRIVLQLHVGSSRSVVSWVNAGGNAQPDSQAVRIARHNCVLAWLAGSWGPAETGDV